MCFKTNFCGRYAAEVHAVGARTVEIETLPQAMKVGPIVYSQHTHTRRHTHADTHTQTHIS